MGGRLARQRTQQIRIGMTASLTGRYATQGSQARAGVEAWVHDTNDAGGLVCGARRLAVSLICHDDASESDRCETLTQTLIETDAIDLLLGPYSSDLTRRAAGVAEQHGRVLWDHGGSSDVIFQAGLKWVVGVLTPASRYFHGVIDLARKRRPEARRLAVVYADAGSFPAEVAGGAVAYGRTRGFGPVATYTYDTGTADFTQILDELQAFGPHVVLGVGRMEDDIRFARQYARHEFDADCVGLIVAAIERFRDELGSAAEGFLGPSQWEPAAAPVPDYGPPVNRILRRFSEQPAVPVDYPMAQAYAGCLLAQRCLEETGTLEQGALRQAASRLRFSTFFGDYEIEPRTGLQIGHTMPVVEWHKGMKRVVWPP